jgi:hypothetical protein
MKLPGRFVGVVLVLIASAACGGDSTGPGPSAASVTGIAGDSQSAPTGATLEFPLSLIALNSSGQPAQGVHVTWSVSPAGRASVNPATETTDASGAASTTVRAGLSTGNITISALVTGVANVVYHATIVDPCGYLAPVAVGDTINGALANGDCFDGVRAFDFYGLSLASGPQNIRIDMHAASNDTYLVLWSGVSPFPFIAFNDDSILDWEGARNSQLDIILPAGDYIVGATSFAPGDAFAYSVAAKTRPASMGGCREVWVMSGVSLTDDISAQDCADSSATPHYYDVARIFLDSGAVLSVSERSTAINPALALYKVIDTLPTDTTIHAYVRQFITSNDDSLAGNNTNAFIRFTTDTANYYDIIIGTSAGGETGAYTFSVDVASSLSSPYRTPANGAREWWRRNPRELLLRSRGFRGHKL